MDHLPLSLAGNHRDGIIVNVTMIPMIPMTPMLRNLGDHLNLGKDKRLSDWPARKDSQITP